MLQKRDDEPGSPHKPAVGIFWLVNGVLVVDRSMLEDAEPYGDCLTHAAGHFERWEEWQRMGAARLVAIGHPEVIATTEYDEWPRGRIVYQTPTRQFLVYADRRLQKSKCIDLVKAAFGLKHAKVIVLSDAHYR
jgi:hypothetical protein